LKSWVIALTLMLETAPIGTSGVLAQPTTPPRQAASNLSGSMIGPALYVSDINRSLKFYTDGLGMQVRMKFGPADRPDVVIGYGTDPTQPGLMLLSDRSGAAPRKIEQVHGFDRIAFRMTDLETLAAKLRATGFSPSDIRVVHENYRMMMVSDPDGYRFELIDNKPGK
jgi:catechol 2,3-dioxygenase-like lactoylglutathione lyase family enzyme